MVSLSSYSSDSSLPTLYNYSAHALRLSGELCLCFLGAVLCVVVSFLERCPCVFEWAAK